MIKEDIEDYKKQHKTDPVRSTRCNFERRTAGTVRSCTRSRDVMCIVSTQCDLVDA